MPGSCFGSFSAGGLSECLTSCVRGVGPLATGTLSASLATPDLAHLPDIAPRPAGTHLVTVRDAKEPEARAYAEQWAFEPELRVLLFTVPTLLRFLSQGLGSTLGRFDSASWSLRFESRWLICCPWAVTTPEPVLAASDGCVGSMLAVR